MRRNIGVPSSTSRVKSYRFCARIDQTLIPKLSTSLANMCENLLKFKSKITSNFGQNLSKFDPTSLLGRLGGGFLKNDARDQKKPNYLRPLGGQVGGSWGPRWR